MPRQLSTIIIGIFIAASCSKMKDDSIVLSDNSKKNNIEFVAPSYFPKPVYDFNGNPPEPKKFRLGRMLFYDPILSRDSCISCGTCHQQSVAFTHLNHTISHGINGLPGSRNSPTLANLAWSPQFMWDGGIPNLEIQPLAPIENHVEMGEKLPNVLRKLNRHPLYRTRFKETFQKDSIDGQQLLKALAQFMVMLVSGNSKYDHFLQGKATLTNEELEGLKIVKEKCASCHAGELFTDFAYHNIGLDSTILDISDLGREMVTKRKQDRRKFKTPSLRNMAVTKPYMHDGRTNDLNTCIKNHGEFDSPNLDSQLKKYVGTGMVISDEERVKINAFINTLTDPILLTDTLFSLRPTDYLPYSTKPAKHCDYVH